MISILILVLNCCRVDNFEQEIRISDVSSLFPLNFDIVYECSLKTSSDFRSNFVVPSVGCDGLFDFDPEN